MTKIRMLFTALTCLYGFYTTANDGVYLSNGGAIYPTQETRVSMEKEALQFVVREGQILVNVRFEFLNPDKTERKLLVGFQAPAAAGDVSDSLANVNQITGFQIMQEERILPYKIKVAECEECALQDPGSITFSQSEPGIFVYLFEITFKPGMNVVQHSYSFPASRSVSYDRFYEYILTTGSKWSGGKIKDLTVDVDMGPDQYFFFSDIFGASASWSVIGTGKVTDRTLNSGEVDCRMVRILSGSLRINVSDFHPEQNIFFGVINDLAFTHIPNDQAPKGIDLAHFNPENNYTKEELRVLRNTVYAQHGYLFSDPELKKRFSGFEWYMPDPNLKMEDIRLTAAEKLCLRELRKWEKE